mgnify:CR=1 FL=1
MIVEFFYMYITEILGATLLLSTAALTFSIINTIRYKRLLNSHKNLMRGVDSKNLEDILNSYMNDVELVLSQLKDIKTDCSNLDSQLQHCVQKVGIVRYNAFDNMGSNQSYSIALLDNDHNGIVLTGLFGRDSSTTYAKPIQRGKSSHPLSKEEKEVIIKAIS